MTASTTYDAIVIGSGFAGAVTSCRLAEAGLDVCILERGRRFRAEDHDFPVHPVTSAPNVPSDEPSDGRSTVQFDVTRLFWGLGNGVWDFRDLGGVLLGQAAGFGGGSLIYANVHLRPPAHVFDARWQSMGTKQPHPYTRKKLDPYFDLVAQMLDVEPLPQQYSDLPKKLQLERAARELNQLQRNADPRSQETYLRSFAPPLAVSFHQKNENAERKPSGVCDLNGNCCMGCPEKAKNTLDLNYLPIAEDRAEVRTLAEVVWIERIDDGKRRFKVDYLDHLAGGAEESVCGKHVFLCAGAVNTTELLLRCREAKKLDFSGNGLGTRFHTNQDALAAIFDCDELQELDRGPTITSSLIYDRKPDERESSARWRVSFVGAAFEPVVGARLRCISGGRETGTAVLAAPAYTISGSYEEGTAIGELTLTDLKGEVQKDAMLETEAGPCGRAEERPEELRHWFLIQDGGLPVELEPMLGMFRSPLWLRRNAFREKQRHPGQYPWPQGVLGDCDNVDRAPASRRIDYAPLPFEALTDLFSGLIRGAVGPQLHEVSELGLQLLRGGALDDASKETWPLLPHQLEKALDRLRCYALDGIGLANENLVSDLLEDAAGGISDELEAGIAALLNGSDDILHKLEGLGLAQRTLQLGVQLMWGTQGGLARDIAERLVTRVFPRRERLMETGVALLKRAIDYRLGNGRAAVLLSMGLDSVPGRLELELPKLPRVGTELRGATSGTRAFLLHMQLEKGTSFPRENAEGTVIITGETGAFQTDEILFAGRQKIGKFYRHEPREVNERFKMPGAKRGSPDPPFRALRFKPDKQRQKNRPLASTARLRAVLPPAIDTPERGLQERVLRDVASCWNGELRTDPLWTFLDRRVTVHPQGGCPMGPEDRGVTNERGEVYGCEGLFVMDAAAFPGPVGANPSATIAAIAEYKVYKFLKSLLKKDRHADKTSKKKRKMVAEEVEALKKKRKNAQVWVDCQGRERLDPLGPQGSAAPVLRSAEPAHRAIGIAFEERMVGTEKRVGARAIELELTAGIDDLADFLARHARDSNVPVAILRGTLTVGNAEPVTIDSDRSSMRVMARHGLDETGREMRTVEYRIVAQHASQGLYELKGVKTIRDDAGFDAWQDSTTLEFELYENGGPPSTGVLELSAAEFLGEQLPSFRVNTDDPARQAWAMASFGKFFFGNLVDIYFPALGNLGSLGASLLRRGHG